MNLRKVSDVKRFLMSPRGKALLLLNIIGITVAVVKVRSLARDTVPELLPVPYGFRSGILAMQSSFVVEGGDQSRVVLITVPRTMPKEEIYTNMRVAARMHLENGSVHKIQVVARRPSKTSGGEPQYVALLQLAPFGNLGIPERGRRAIDYVVTIQDNRQL